MADLALTPTGIVSSLGLLGILLLMIPESACIPIPSEVTLLAAGVGARHGWFTVGGAVAAATAGNLIGSMIAYGIGRRAGAMSGVPRRGLARAGALVDRWGLWGILLARLLPLARTFVALPAGRAGVPVGRFLLLSLVGCALWAGGFVLAGYAGWAAGASALAELVLAALLVVLAVRALAGRRGARPPAGVALRRSDAGGA